ncbi:FadR/GntR family transcriptional regulator [Brevibacterium atlanticum]|uniref:FadR/GntR family transcriptional regulator n=1 Tax=Brevibacterium atlanticum TaxID=2697563 RepID=UPI001D18AE66|nr:GntR family transcriptional regulator [Brevibacterium atlanticum]
MDHADSGGDEAPAANAEGTSPAAEPTSGLAPAHSRGGNVFEHTIAALLRAIRLGQYLVGDKLPAERDLAARIKVSRATLRQALSELQTAGIVTVRRGRYGGTFVTRLPSAGDDASEGSIDPVELDDAVRFRHVLETAAARIVASRTLEHAEVEALTTAESECREVFGAPGESAEKFRALDARFHLSIAELTRIPSLVAASASTRDRINALLDRIPFIETNVEHSCAQHREILDAVLAGDPDLAAELAAQHAEGTEQLLRGFLEQQ